MPAFSALSVVVAMPPLSVVSTEPILEERWTLDRAFDRTPATVGGGVGLLALVVGGFGALMWKRGRDVRFRGSQVDQVMGGPVETETQTVPLFEKGVSVVEFAPPEDLRPGQIGTLVDEEANTLDVTATIVDLAVRKHLVIEELEKTWFLGKPDWKLSRLGAPTDDLLPYERELLDGLFEDGDQVELSDLRKKFAPRLQKVKDALYADVVRRKWFRAPPRQGPPDVGRDRRRGAAARGRGDVRCWRSGRRSACSVSRCCSAGCCSSSGRSGCRRVRRRERR